MCRQAWFPPSAARDGETLTKYLAKLEKSCGGHGNGVAWIEMPDGAYDVVKGVKLTTEKAAELLTNRPLNAWGVFHTRFVSAGTRGNSGCHPHVYVSPSKHHRTVVLTHNGTWLGWSAACLALGVNYPTDSATIAALMTMYGFGKVAAAVDETVVAAVKEEGGNWRLRAWKDTLPLQHLKNGGVASEGGDGEFDSVGMLCKGGHNLSKPRTYSYKSSPAWTYPAKSHAGCRPLSHDIDLPVYLQDKQPEIVSVSKGSPVSGGSSATVGTSTTSAALASTSKPGSFGKRGTWIKCEDGDWRQVETARDKARDEALVALAESAADRAEREGADTVSAVVDGGDVPGSDDDGAYLLPGVADVTKVGGA
jgi:hypothetical protein